MTVHITARQLFLWAERLPGDPQFEDYGVAFAAEARHRATAFGRDIYEGPFLKAAALAHELVSVPALEHSNGRFALQAAAGYLELCGIRLAPKPDEAARLIQAVYAHEVGVRGISRAFKSWAV